MSRNKTKNQDSKTQSFRVLKEKTKEKIDRYYENDLKSVKKRN